MAFCRVQDDTAERADLRLRACGFRARGMAFCRVQDGTTECADLGLGACGVRTGGVRSKPAVGFTTHGADGLLETGSGTARTGGIAIHLTGIGDGTVRI